MEISHLTTDRLKLRIVDSQVLDFVFTNYSEYELKHFFSEDHLERISKQYQGGLSTFNKSFVFFYLIDQKTERCIGWCGYHTWYKDHDRAEIGYVLFDDSYMGKGIMTEALKPIIQYGFNKMKLHRIEAMVGPFNTASLKLMDKFGFVKEGHLKEHYLRDGVYEDSVVFGLLKS